MYVKFRPSIHTYYFVYRCNQTSYIYISNPFLSVSDRKNLKTYHVYQIFCNLFYLLIYIICNKNGSIFVTQILQHNSTHVMNKTKNFVLFLFDFAFIFLKKYFILFFKGPPKDIIVMDEIKGKFSLI